ncbi:hypothetical protein ONZ45_g11220 [Pleurotus djamor]|nr:hypothetical protein ONZ45_g11220 [Pleurotus djamor]
MMDTEVIITRKRKRQAVDPCLGYYQGVPPPNATKATSKPLLPVTSHPYPSWTQATKNNVNAPTNVNENLPTSPIQPTIDDDLDHRERSLSPLPLSVEDFLKQNKKTVQRKYGRRARRVVLDSDDRDESAQDEDISRSRSESPPPRKSKRLAEKKRIQRDPGTDDSDYQPQSPDESSSSESTPIKRKVTKLPLSKRLFTAAVLSDAYPVDSLAAGSSKEKVQRKPLRFQRPPSPSPPQKLYNLTDPRKTHPFEGSSFASKSSKVSQRPCKPINTWVTPHSKLPPPPAGSKPFKPKLPVPTAASQPVRRRLVMIPASEAPPDRVRVRSQLTHTAKPPLPGTRIPIQFKECPLV